MEFGEFIRRTFSLNRARLGSTLPSIVWLLGVRASSLQASFAFEGLRGCKSLIAQWTCHQKTKAMDTIVTFGNTRH